MKINLLPVRKIVKGFCIILTFSVLTPEKIEAQSVIYKKDGTQINVVQVDTLSKILSYKLSNDADTILHFISKSAIDSIHFENGETLRFFSPVHKFQLASRSGCPKTLPKEYRWHTMSRVAALRRQSDDLPRF